MHSTHRSSRDDEEIGEIIRQLSDRTGKDLLELQHNATKIPDPGIKRNGAVMRSGEGFYELEVEGDSVEHRASAQGAHTGILGVMVERDGDEQVYVFRSQDLKLERPVSSVYERDEREILRITYSKDI